MLVLLVGSSMGLFVDVAVAVFLAASSIGVRCRVRTGK